MSTDKKKEIIAPTGHPPGIREVPRTPAIKVVKPEEIERKEPTKVKPETQKKP